MRAMVLEKIGKPLIFKEIKIPSPDSHQILVKIEACGVCRTDLHIVDGELPHPKLPLVLGHQIVGRVEKMGEKVSALSQGQRIGIPWLGSSCGHCPFCEKGKENLCDSSLHTGYQIDGGFAEYCVANADYCFPIPENFSSVHAAPLLCAGLIGYRAYRMAEDAQKIGFYGFGASAHILTQIAVFQKKEIYAFTREGDHQGQEFAQKLGAVWAGSSQQIPPEKIDVAIIFAPVGSLVPIALRALQKGGKVICAGIHMSDIPTFPYSILWEERSICSVAHLTRQDGWEFFQLISHIPIHTEVTTYPLEKANEALEDLRKGRITGAAVLTI